MIQHQFPCPVCGRPVHISHRPPRIGWWRFGPLRCPSCQASLLLVRRHPLRHLFHWAVLTTAFDLRPALDRILPWLFSAVVTAALLSLAVSTMNFLLHPYRLLVDPGDQSTGRQFALQALKNSPLLERPLTRRSRDKEVERLLEGDMETTEDGG